MTSLKPKLIIICVVSIGRGAFQGYLLKKFSLLPLPRCLMGLLYHRTGCIELIIKIETQLYSMCSLVVSVLDTPAVDTRSNPGSGSALLTLYGALYTIVYNDNNICLR